MSSTQLGTSSTPLPDAQRRWRVLAGSSLVVAFGMPAVWGSTMGLFLKPIQHDLGWTRADIAFSLTLSMLVGFLLVPAAGWLIDRVRLRPLVLVGVLLQSLGIAALSLLGGRVWNFYALSMVLIVCGTGASMLTMSKLIRGWFSDSLGKALGVLFASAGVGAAVQPLLAQALLQNFGWRRAYVLLAVVGLLVSGLAAWLTAKDSPTASPVVKVAPDSTAAPPTSMLSLLGHRNSWVLAGWSSLVGYAAAGIRFHFAPLIEDRGATPAQSAVALSLMGVGGLLGNLMTGWLLDRFSARRIASALMLVPMCAALVLFASANVWMALLVALVFGLCSSSETSLTAFLVGRYFEPAVYGRAYSIIFVAGAVGGGLAPWVVGVMQERAGSYNSALIVNAVFFAAAAVLVALLPETPSAAHPRSTEHEPSEPGAR